MTYPLNPAATDFPVTDIIAKRWSPVIFDPAPLTDAELGSLFEAARWTPSCYNEQPWRFVYARKGDAGREEIEGLLMEGNSWAKNAGLLIVAFGKKTFTRNGKPNHYHLYDTGAAAMNITLQAEAMGLISHQMGGFATDKANAVCGLTEDFEVGSMMAVGRTGDIAGAPAELVTRQKSPRTRNAQHAFAFKGRYEGE